jgi:hypothetical protein
MSLRDRDKLNRIEELKTKLFSKGYETKMEHRDSFTRPTHKDVPEGWGDNGGSTKMNLSSFYSRDRFFMKTSIFKNFFLFSLVFFILTLAYASYVFFAGGNTVSNENIDITVLGNNFVAGGEELSLVIGVVNSNSSPLDLVDLVVEYPKSSSEFSTDLSVPTERHRLTIGTIPAGAIHNENIKIVLFGQQGSARPIKISIEYRVEGSNAIFVKEKFFEVTLSSTPIELSLDAPFTISPNQDVTLDIKLALNATKPVPQILLKVDYPVGFEFISAEPAPSLGDNIWNMGDLVPGAERSISVMGKMLDVSDGEEKVFHIKSGSQSTGDKSVIDVVFNSLSHTVLVKRPFIEARLFVNGVYGRDYVTNAKNLISGEIRWANNLDTKVNDLEIRAKILGNAVNQKTIRPERGFYNSLNDVIVWDKNSQDRFREVNPGDSGSVKFALSPLSLFSSTSGILEDPSINIEISISGKQQVEGFALEDLNNFETSTIRVISDVSFIAKALHYSGPFNNSGPIPPKAEAETTYTITWALSNTANNISKAVIKSRLPSWVRFVGPVSPTGEDLVFNLATKEIVWNIGRIPKGTGITSADHSVSFQVAITPSLSQVDTVPVIINGATLTGYDDFAKVDIRVDKTSLYTELDNDPLFPPGGGTVVE